MHNYIPINFDNIITGSSGYTFISHLGKSKALIFMPYMD